MSNWNERNETEGVLISLSNYKGKIVEMQTYGLYLNKISESYDENKVKEYIIENDYVFLTGKFHDEHYEIYRIPFTSVYIDNRYNLYAKRSDIENDTLHEMPIIDSYKFYSDNFVIESEFYLLQVSRDILKCTSVYNAEDNFLNMNLTNEQLFLLAKYDIIEDLYIQTMFNKLKDRFIKCGKIKNKYDETIDYGRLRYENVKQDIEVRLKNDIVSYMIKELKLKDDTIYLNKRSLLIQELEAENNDVNNIYMCNLYGKMNEDTDYRVFVKSNPDSRIYTLVYVKSKKNTRTLGFDTIKEVTIDLDNVKNVDEKDLYELFKIIVPGWEPGKDYKSLFIDMNNINLKDIEWN